MFRFHQLSLTTGRTVHIETSMHRLLFVRTGSLVVDFLYSDNAQLKVLAGQMFLLPAGKSYQISSFSDSSAVLCLDWAQETDLRRYIRFLSLDYLKTEYKIGGISGLDGSRRPLSTQAIERNLIEIEKSMDELQRHLRISTLRAEQLLVLMGCYYTDFQLCGFFFNLLTNVQSFRDRVMMYAPKCRYIKELASMCKMKTDSFRVYFISVFGIGPHIWLQSHRLEMLRYDLYHTEMSEDDICEKYAFNSVRSLNYFCVKQLGKSIREIR